MVWLVWALAWGAGGAPAGAGQVDVAALQTALAGPTSIEQW